MPNLTKRQKEIFDYLKSFIEKKGYSPTVEEIRKHFKLSANSTVHEHLQTLEEKGVINKNEHQARSIDIVQKENTVEVPIVGTIAAGQPIETIENYSGTVVLAKNEVFPSSKYYALKVAGDSMIEEGIFDGDTVVIRQQPTADNGQTVVAIIDENEATLKKFYKEKDRIRLQPANQALFPLFRTEVEIRGIVVKIIRNLELNLEENNFLKKVILEFPYTRNSKRVADIKNDRETKPFLQWVGGKREMIRQYKELLPKKINNYFEPFLGGGAMFFYLKPNKATLNDNNEELILSYKGVRDNPSEVIGYLRELKKRHSKELYEKIRNLDREIDIFEKLDNYEIAARMIYLNQTCFNGLYRVNQKRQFNVPIGSSLNRLICDPTTINNVSNMLKKVELSNEDFEKVVSKSKKGDFIYFDPPYYPISKHSDFTRYTKEKFYKEDQERLKNTIDILTKKGVKIMLSNSDCDYINELYSSYDIIKVTSGRNLSCKKDKRGKVSEVVIINYKV